MAVIDSEQMIRFGDFELDLRTGELRRRGIRLPIQGRPVEVLAILVKNAGKLVTHEDLRAQLWPADTFVDFDHSLHNAVARLRGALRDTAETPRFIETLPRRGYRFIGSVEPASTSDVAPPTLAPPAPPDLPSPPVSRAVRRRFMVIGAVSLALATLAGAAIYLYITRPVAPRYHSIAVLPLENLSGDPAEEYFVDGMTDELITDLAKLSSLRVISRTSVMRYKNNRKPLAQVARELGVDAVVEGSVSRSGPHVRISAQLIDVSSDRHLWADSYDEPLEDVVTLQMRLSRAIAAHIRTTLTPSEQQQLAGGHPVNTAAYEAYLKGRFHWNKRTRTAIETAIQYFNRALSADSNFSLAYAGLADAYNILGSGTIGVIPGDEAHAKAVWNVSKALQIDNNSAEAHAALGDLRLIFEWDWKGAEAEFRHAIALSPNYANAHHWYAELLLDLGRFDEAFHESRVAQQLDPLSAIVSVAYASRLYSARRYEDASRQLQNGLELDPGMHLAHAMLGRLYERRRMFPEAIGEFEKARELSGGSPTYLSNLVGAYAASGRREEACSNLELLRKAVTEGRDSPYRLAIAYAALEEKQKATAMLTRAYREHSSLLDNLYVDPDLDTLRSEPAFVELLSRMRFPINNVATK